MRVHHPDLAGLDDPTGIPGSTMLEAPPPARSPSASPSCPPPPPPPSSSSSSSWCAWWGAAPPSGAPHPPPPPAPPPQHARQLLLQLDAQRSRGFLCDVVLVVQRALFRAHKNVLAASSAYLKALVLHDNLVNLDHEMVSPAVFRAVLDFIYTGRLLLHHQNHPQQHQQPQGGPGRRGPGVAEAVAEPPPSLASLLAAASYLQIPELVALCKRKLKRAGKAVGGPLRGSSVALGGPPSPPRGLRAATPVIQSCFGGRPGEPPLLLSTHCAELYAAPAAAPAAPSPGPLCGLDLSKKGSPDGPDAPPAAPAHGESRLRAAAAEGRPPSPAAFQEPGGALPPPPPPPPRDLLLPGPFPHPLLLHHHPHHPPPQLAREPSPGRAEAGADFLYRWMKPEPWAGGYGAEEEGEEGGGGRPAAGRGNGRSTDDEEDDEEEDDEEEEAMAMAVADGEDDEEEEEGASTGGSSGGGPSPAGASAGASAGGGLERFLGYGEPPEGFGGDNLYVCIPCGKGFPSSEHLNAHVEAHSGEDELYRREAEAAAAAAEGVPGGGPGSPFFPEKPPPALPATPGPPPPAPAPPGPPGPPPPSGLALLRPYRCPSCEKAYKDPATLRQHEKSHWLTRPYPCAICGKKFTQRGTMTRHMRSHLGLKPFACQACGMRFTRQYRLTEHMRIHSGEKPYQCRVCGGKFAQQRNLLSHMKMHAAAAAAASAAAASSTAGAAKGGGLLMLKGELPAGAGAEGLLAMATPEGGPPPLHPLFLAESKAALQSLYLGLSPDKAAHVLAQSAAAAAAQLHNDHHPAPTPPPPLHGGRAIERFSPP